MGLTPLAKTPALYDFTIQPPPDKKTRLESLVFSIFLPKDSFLFHLEDSAMAAANTTTDPIGSQSVVELIGHTPLVRLNKIPQSLGIVAQVYAKVELFNAGGSVKDRIALRMIEEAEKSGRIKPGDTLIEPTSGNTYVSFSLCCYTGLMRR